MADRLTLRQALDEDRLPEFIAQAEARDNGVVEGACGVSGGTAQEDEDCSRAGVAQL